MNEMLLINQLLSISLDSHSGEDEDNRMMNIGFREARNKSLRIIKDYLAKEGLLVNEDNRNIFK